MEFISYISIVIERQMNKYENGYYPKLEYWTVKLVEAITEGNIRAVDTAHRKLNHFIDQQWKLEFGGE